MSIVEDGYTVSTDLESLPALGRLPSHAQSPPHARALVFASITFVGFTQFGGCVTCIVTSAAIRGSIAVGHMTTWAISSVAAPLLLRAMLHAPVLSHVLEGWRLLGNGWEKHCRFRVDDSQGC